VRRKDHIHDQEIDGLVLQQSKRFHGMPGAGHAMPRKLEGVQAQQSHRLVIIQHNDS
jgi:hypothetical protein